MQHADWSITAAIQARMRALDVELRGERRQDRLREMLDELMRLQAVMAPDRATAVACLDSLAMAEGDRATFRVLAASLFAGHRERIAKIRAREMARAEFVATRARERTAAAARARGGGA